MPSPTECLEAALGRVVDQIPEEDARPLIDGMGQLRIDEGPGLGDKLTQTTPQERRFRDGIVPALLSATDKFDGWWARRIGTTETGREIDREGDRGFVMPQQKALTQNGEIPPIHYTLKAGRERAMEVLRAWEEIQGGDVASRPAGKQKTAVEMTLVTAAHTPLSRSENLMRWGASLGTALSLTALVEEVFDQVNLSRGDKAEKTDTSRNSTARQVSAGPLERLATFVDEKAPGITPSHVTLWGKRMVEASALLAVARPDSPAAATALYTAGSLLDTFDGSLARKKGVDSTEGMVEDVRADLEQQIATLAALSIIARKRGNKVAATNYAIATMMTPLSALTRAQAESQGFIVAEGGMGTRVGRGILGGAGMALNGNRDASDIISATLAAGTVNTVKERRDVVRRGTGSDYCVGENDVEKFMEDARIRKEEGILPYAGLGIAVGTVLLAEGNISSVRELFKRARPEEPESGTPAVLDVAA